MTTPPLTLSQIQQQLTANRGREYWRSLDELAATPAFEEFLHREFPRQASEWQPNMSRRRFLQLMGASLALAGLSACASPAEKIVPYVSAPENSTPGKSLYFATAMPLGGYGMGLLVQSHENRPTKVEGNPDHPASLGATDAFAQASVLTLYDPDRAKGITRRGEESDWPGFLAALRKAVVGLPADGAGLRILTETVTSPTLAAQFQTIAAAFPAAVWHQYEPVNRDAVYRGAALAFGKPVESVYRFDQAQVILSLDSDFLTAGPGRVRYARDFAAGRRAESAAEGFRQAQPT
ncbi:MAG: TAT-variant-translocated molybdopterin oxidoreductase, partial [Caldilineaceae bacterium]